MASIKIILQSLIRSFLASVFICCGALTITAHAQSVPTATPAPSPIASPASSPTDSPAATTPAPVKGRVVLPPEKSQPVTIGRFEKAPVIDGRLDDAVWQNATTFKNFYQTSPGDNTAP